MSISNLPPPKRWAREAEISNHTVTALEASLINVLSLHEAVAGEEGPTCATCASLDLVDPILYPCPTALQVERVLDQVRSWRP